MTALEKRISNAIKKLEDVSGHEINIDLNWEADRLNSTIERYGWNEIEVLYDTEDCCGLQYASGFYNISDTAYVVTL